jgi:hypothetical protein
MMAQKSNCPDFLTKNLDIQVLHQLIKSGRASLKQQNKCVTVVCPLDSLQVSI